MDNWGETPSSIAEVKRMEDGGVVGVSKPGLAGGGLGRA